LKHPLFIISLACFFALSIYTVAYATEPPTISGETWILIDVDTGKILGEKDALKPMEPASTTKIMTAILALEKGNLEDVIKVSKNPPMVEGSNIQLQEGEKLKLEDMLYGMLLDSGNDAATAIAEHIGGSEQHFVEMMNEKARQIGAKDTKYINPTGLVDEGHITTAYDLALIGRYALMNLPKFREIVSTEIKEIPWQPMNANRKLENTNQLLGKYQGADGVKTGYTSRAGRTLVATATRDGWQLMAVVLKSGWDTVFQDAATLLDFGFSNFEKVELVKEGESIVTLEPSFGEKALEVISERGFSAIVNKNIPITREINVDEDIKAPIASGSVLGHLLISQDDEQICSINLIAKEDVKRKIYTYWWFYLGIFLTLFCLYMVVLRLQRAGDSIMR